MQQKPKRQKCSKKKINYYTTDPWYFRDQKCMKKYSDWTPFGGENFDGSICLQPTHVKVF
jgi:hypothetical protein